MELRILRKKAQPFDAGFPQYYDVLQYRMRVYDIATGTESFHWTDVPIVMED